MLLPVSHHQPTTIMTHSLATSYAHVLRRDRAVKRSVNIATAVCMALAIGLAGTANQAQASPVTYVGSVSSPQGLNVPCFSPANAGNGSGLSTTLSDGVTPWTTTSAAVHNSLQGCTSGYAFGGTGGDNSHQVPAPKSESKAAPAKTETIVTIAKPGEKLQDKGNTPSVGAPTAIESPKPNIQLKKPGA